MEVRIKHRVIAHGKSHDFIIVISLPFMPPEEFMFVFRSNESGGDDCALLLDTINGWDATHEQLLVRSKEWNIDEWHIGASEREAAFADAKQQLIDVVGCCYACPQQVSKEAIAT